METEYGLLKNNLGRRIAELREARQWTQEAFAEHANVTIQYIQRIEQGKENLTLFSLVKLAKLLEVEVSEFFVLAKSARNKRGRPKGKITK